MDSKVVFFDIDGTLVSKNGQVSKRVQEALVKLKENGHYMILCTGRNQTGIKSLRSLGFDGVICSAGGYVEVNNRVIFQSHIDNKDIQMIREVFERNHVLYTMEADIEAYESQEMGDYVLKLFFEKQDNNSEIERLKQQRQKDLYIYSLDEYTNQPIQTICYIAKNKESIQEPQEIISKRCQFLIYQQMNKDFINGEVMKKGVHKGTGVEKVMEAIHLPMENSIGFGDSMNDLEMIKTCHYGVVMENGDPLLKDHASAVCESVDDDGVYHELKRLQLI